MPNRCLLSERPAHIEDRQQVGHRVGNTVVTAMMENKTADLVVAVITIQLKTS